MLHAVLNIYSDAETVSEALRPEAGRELPRTETRIEITDNIARIEIDATDVSAMRAAVNSYLECIRVTEDIGRIIR